jgi:hypothetical protein
MRQVQEQQKVIDGMKARLTGMTGNQTNVPPVATSVSETPISAALPSSLYQTILHPHQQSKSADDEYSRDCNVSAEQLREFSKDPDPPKSNSPGSNTTDVPADFLPADRKDISMAHAKKHYHTAQKIPRFNLPCTHEPSNTDIKLCVQQMNAMYAEIVHQAHQELYAEVKVRSKQYDLSIEEAFDQPKKNIKDFHNAALKSFRRDQVQYIIRCLDVIKIPLKLGHRLDWVTRMFQYVENRWDVKFIHSSANQNFVCAIITRIFRDCAGARFRRGMYRHAGFKFYERKERSYGAPFGKGVKFTEKPLDVQVDGMLVRGIIATPESASAVVESREGAGRPGSASTHDQVSVDQAKKDQGRPQAKSNGGTGDDQTQKFKAVPQSQFNNARGVHTAHRLGTAPPHKGPQSTHHQVAVDPAKKDQGHPQAKSDGGTSVHLRPGAIRGPRPPPKNGMSTEEQKNFLEGVDNFIREEEEAEAAAKGGGGDDEDQSHVQV